MMLAAGSGPPVVTAMTVVPVAGHDSMLLEPERRAWPVLHPQRGDPRGQCRPHRRRRSSRRRAHPPDAGGRAAAGRRPVDRHLQQHPARCAGALRRSRRRRPRAADLRPAHDHPCGDGAGSGVARSAGTVPRRAGRRAAGRRPAARCRRDARLPFLRRRPQQDRSALSRSDARPRTTGCACVTRRRSRRRRSCASPRRRRPATASTTSSSRAACSPASRRWKPSTALAERFPDARITLDPERRLVARGGRAPLPRSAATCSPMRKTHAVPRTASPAARSWPSSAARPAFPPRPT